MLALLQARPDLIHKRRVSSVLISMERAEPELQTIKTDTRIETLPQIDVVSHRPRAEQGEK